MDTNEILSQQLVDYVKRLRLDFRLTGTEFGYENPVLILVDAVLSMNRKYDAFVVPRIRLMEQTGLCTLMGLRERIQKEGVTGRDIWE
jgi:hypothetical protein